MDRPYIICHMVTSLDGKVTGEFLSHPACAAATDMYYRINRDCKADAFACGRVTMQESFTGGWYPDLSQYEPGGVYGAGHIMDHIIDEQSGFYAVAFDPHGRLGWRSPTIVDDDPGYDGAQIIEILTEDVDPRYLTYLESVGISYIFSGEKTIELPLALFKLKTIFGIETVLLEGGSIINGAFEREDLIDELSLVVAPVVGSKDDKPLFFDGISCELELVKAQTLDGGVLVLNYKR